jgi:transposase
MFRDLQAWTAIRQTVLEGGASKRQICRETGLHWNTLQKIIRHEAPPGYTKRPAVLPTEAPCRAVIERILVADRLRPWNQRHTPEQIAAILHDEYGWDVSAVAVCRYITPTLDARASVWVEVADRLSQILGAKAMGILLSSLSIDPRRLSLGSLRQLRRVLQEVGGAGASRKTPQLAGPSTGPAWLIRVLLGKESLSAVRAAVGDCPDLALLYRAVRNGGAKRRAKALTVLGLLKGISLRRIAQTLHRRSLNGVSRYWRIYRERGANYLLNAHAWKAKKRADDSIRKALFETLHSPPSAHEINRTTWRMDDLRTILMDRGIDISRETIRNIIKDAKYQWKKAHVVLTSNDPEYQEKLKRMTAILSGLKPGERFFSIDEFGPFAVKMRAGRALAGPGECPRVPQFQKSKGSLIVTAALELSTNQVTHFYSAKKNTGEMLRLINWLLVEYAGCEKLYLSWDAASWHDSTALLDRVAAVNDGTYRKGRRTPLVELVPLPSRAQFLNVIESVFSGMAKAIIHSSDYQSVDEAKGAIDRYFRERNEHFRRHPKPAGKKIWGKEPTPSEFSTANNCKDPQWCREK